VSVKDFLVEIGTEELPPKALQSLSEAFTNAILAGLAERQLSHGEVQSFATPRRLACVITALEVQAEDQAQEVFGPPADRARDADGNWSPAAQGFARKNNVSPDQLEVADTEKGPRLVHRSVVSGQKAVDCLPQIVRDSIKSLPVPKRMRWGTGRTEFVRPVHWVLVLLGTEVMDCELLGKTASNTTRGHRFHSHGELIIDQPCNYQTTLADARVVASFSQRRHIIREQIQQQADLLGAHAVISEDLLDEVTGLVEWPVALTGCFEARFLRVPTEALISSMKEHQKYFHVVDEKGKLLPHFITISNIESLDPQQVISGNERVIRPRLSDADFFFTSDQKESLASRVDQLKSIVFQQQLGTLFDKTTRLVALSAALAKHTGADQEQAQRAAFLSKTDLITLMVGEFADMQGIAGRYYALSDGESEAVADALQQQYWPKFTGDKLPEGPVATTLALADRLDTLVGIFGIGQAPTGSRDPFALRRASLGVLRILVTGNFDIDLRLCLLAAVEQYAPETLHAETVEQVMDYMLERFRAWYEDEDIPAEVFKAVSAKQLSIPLDIHRRVHAVHAFTALPQAAALAAANKRVSNILSKQGKGYKAGEVSEDLLLEKAEQELAQQLRQKQDQTAALLAAGAYEETLATLADLQVAVDRFFDEVMVMAEDEALRNNRLNLLKALRDQFLQVADISQLVVAKTG
jgi:glycyl-tRNA synthetase beta chain